VLDEIPGAYKDIDEVMANQADLVEVVHTLKQVLCVKGEPRLAKGQARFGLLRSCPGEESNMTATPLISVLELMCEYGCTRKTVERVLYNARLKPHRAELRTRGYTYYYDCERARYAMNIWRAKRRPPPSTPAPAAPPAPAPLVSMMSHEDRLKWVDMQLRRLVVILNARPQLAARPGVGG
jgi:hypothetical protein